MSEAYHDNDILRCVRLALLVTMGRHVHLHRLHVHASMTRMLCARRG